jgi:hypothetical protein
LTEAISCLLGYSQVYTNIDFEMISTTVMVQRPGYDRIAPLALVIVWWCHLMDQLISSLWITKHCCAWCITTAALVRANTFQENAITRKSVFTWDSW